MKTFSPKILIVLLSLLVWSCQKDDDDTEIIPMSPSSPTVNQVSMQEMTMNEGLKVINNPSGFAPLTAEISFQTNSNANSEITILGSQSIYHSFEENSKTHKLDIVGLYPGIENQVVLKVSTANSYALDTVKIITDSLPGYFPDVTVEAYSPSLVEEGWVLYNLHLTDGTLFRSYPTIIDNEGVIRWFLNFETPSFPGLALPVELTQENTLLFTTEDYIKEFNFMGYEEKSVPIPSVYTGHHDVIKKGSNYILCVAKENTPVVQNGSTVESIDDHIIELNSIGTVVREWDFREILDVDRSDIIVPLQADWFHMNAVYYSESDNTLLVSGRNQGIIKVDMKNNLKWILHPHKDWGNAGFDGSGPDTKPFLLTAIDGSGNAYDSLVQYGYNNVPDFGWNWGQHAPLILPNGNLFLFDNGANRNYQQGTYSRAVEYKIDEENMTVQQVWQYGKERGNETYSEIISDVDYLEETGNILFAPGIIGSVWGVAPNSTKVVEVSRPGGTVVFEATLHFKNERITQGSFDMSYRAEKVKLYH
ncbi:MAG: aryl-sulfate sulfotransferase [Vicingaceae bacterium]